MALTRQKVDLLNEGLSEELIPKIVIKEISDVQINNSTLISNDIISYNDDDGKWVNNKVYELFTFSDIKEKPNTISGYGITDAYTKTEIDTKLSSTFRYKGTVQNYSDLPPSALHTEEPKTGDVWNIINADKEHGIKAGDNVCWDGAKWDVLGGVTDLSNYYTKSEINTKVIDLDNRKANIADLKPVAFTGKYTDLDGEPQNLSDLIDDTDVKPIKKAQVAVKVGYTSTGTETNPIYINNDGAVVASTANVGASNKPIYMSSGVIKESDSNIGGVINPIYMENGELKASNQTVGLGGNKIVYLQSGSFIESNTNVGSSKSPVYLNDGAITACDYTLEKSVPSDAKFTDTVYTAGTNITIDKNNVISATGTTAIAWNNITGKPTTLSGYGITNAYTKTEVDNIKTIIFRTW